MVTTICHSFHYQVVTFTIYFYSEPVHASITGCVQMESCNSALHLTLNLEQMLSQILATLMTQKVCLML